MKWMPMLVLAAPVLCAELGDPAPPLQISAWIKGDAVALPELKGKKPCVVEFWATWCGPCRESIPHLTGMQKRFGDKVVFVGVTDETADKVRPFVEGMGDRMGYAVALDDGGKTRRAYLDAYGIDGIPHAFVIDRSGKVVWHGHPMDGLDKVLQAVIDGIFDLARFKEAAEAREKAGKLANEYLTQVCKGAPLDSVRELGGQVVELGGRDAQLMNDFAWNILTHEKLPNRDLPLALRAAQAAVEASEGSDPAILDTCARALSDNGMPREAVATEKRAILLCKEEDAKLKARLETALAGYEKKAAASTKKP